MKILIIGTYLPLQCGIATFSHDLYRSLRDKGQDVDVLAISAQADLNYPREVVFSISRNELSDYKLAALWINSQKYDACIIQHEFGIFGGPAGNFLLTLLKGLKIPVISNLHTVLQEPSAEEYEVIQQLAAGSSMLTVMTQRAISMLQDRYHLPADKLRLIPHGVPEFGITAAEAKEYLGLEGKTVMLSFGLLGRSKGFNVAIEAVSKIRDENFVYIILGATHPNVLREEGEQYRNELIQLAANLNLSGKVQFVNKYASDTLLQIYLKACDIYVTPYPHENQMSSGTLSFALGAGAAVISTPYWYAKDLLAEGRGCLFDFNDADALSHCVQQLIDTPSLMQWYRQNALRFGSSMSWSNVGQQQVELIATLLASQSRNKSMEIVRSKAVALGLSFSKKAKGQHQIAKN